MPTFLDPLSLAVVGGGTLAATCGQCGPRACRAALAVIGELPRKGFDAQRARADLSRQINEIAQDGLVRSHVVPTGDAEIDEATGALIAARSLDALVAQHRMHRRKRLARAEQARGVVLRMAELAPVLGLAGTLLSLGTLADGGTARAGLTAAIGMAVLTTLYGLVLANFIAAPLAAWIDRRAIAEDRAREDLFAWLEREIARADPRAATHHGLEAAA